MAEFGAYDHRHRLNHMNPAAMRAALGDIVYDLLNAYNDLAAKHNALMAHLDTANVAGIGNTNAATYDATNVALALPENRTATD